MRPIRRAAPSRPPGRWAPAVLSAVAVLASAAASVLVVGAFARPARAQAEASAAPAPSVAVLRFQVHSERKLGYLADSLSELLARRVASTGEARVVPAPAVAEAAAGRRGFELPDAELREIAAGVGADAVVTGSLTELAGQFSLDLRVTPRAAGGRSQTLVATAASDERLLASLDELAARVVGAVAGDRRTPLLGVQLEGALDLEATLLERIESRDQLFYDPELAAEDVRRLEEHRSVATASVSTERGAEGVRLSFEVVRAERIFGAGAAAGETAPVVEVEIRGNRRIEADAIRTRIGSRVGEPLREAQVAGDVREIFALGFFRSVDVKARPADGGVKLIYEVEENPVIREIAISGNDNIDSDEIKDTLTLTTGSTLDYPLLHENKQRIEALYRAKGYFLANVSYEIEELAPGSVSVNLEVGENEKLKLRRIEFSGNEAFDDGDLREDFRVKRWRWYSWATSWFDRTGTYSEPLFMQDLREVEKKYTNAGYLEIEVGEPVVDASEDGLVVRVGVDEGPQYAVGSIDVAGDQSIDLDVLRERLRLSQGEVFNRSHLTEDVEALETYFTDRGFYFASVEPGTRLDEESQTVDVEFQVKKGPLYFIRKVNISGNTRTVDEVIRREMKVVEGQLYSARSIRVSDRRVRQLRFFDDVGFEPRATENPAQLDLDVRVVERPTGAFSFGAGFSSQDNLVFTASLSQANLFGRGYGVNLSADIGGVTSRFFLSFTDPYFLGSTYSFATTFFLTDIRFEDFSQNQYGVDLRLGHALREDNTARGTFRYSFASREVEQNTNVVAASSIQREIIQGREATSLVSLGFRADTRNDFFSPTGGKVYGLTTEFAGIGGFTNFLRFEGQMSWYLGAPSFLFDRSSFVLHAKAGYTIPLNAVSDFDVPQGDFCRDGTCVEGGTLTQIDEDLDLPLTERYFLGGIGAFQLRGYRARSVGPRRAQVYEVVRGVYTTRGRTIELDENDQPFFPCQPGIETNSSGVRDDCNSLSDRDDDDFAILAETDVIGGASFVTTSFEYRFPISAEVGLQGVFFTDGGNAFAEGENLFDVTEWRYAYGGGVLWFSPFGPLQLVLGFPIDPLVIEESPVFEFSVGGIGL